MSSTNGKGKEPKDIYPTPRAVVAALMQHVSVRPTDHFLEPCKAGGNIYDQVPLPEQQKHWAELFLGRDYLTHDFGRKFDLIITNPPFSLAEAFLEKCLSELAPDGTLIFLQRLNFLGSIKRSTLFGRVGFPNKIPLIIPRPSFVRGGTDSCEYAWLTWDRGGRLRCPAGASHILTAGQVVAA